MRKSVWLVLSAVAVFSLSVIAADKPPEDFQKVMKDNGAALQKIAKDVDAKDYDAVATTAAQLKNNFATTVGKFFTARKDDAALKMCTDAFKASESLETAAKAKNDAGIADARKALTGACGACHTAKREKQPDGTFLVK